MSSQPLLMISQLIFFDSRSDLHADPSLVYNLHALAPLLTLRNSFSTEQRSAFDDRAFAVRICQGFFSTKQVEHDGEELLVTVISRRRWARAGTRFAKRGIDGGGDVANFAETETIVRSRKQCFSFVQVRGSVPRESAPLPSTIQLIVLISVVWTERPSTGPPAVKIHEPLRDSLRPFRLHFYSLLERYGPVHILNLMSSEPTGHLAPEEKLSAAYAGLDQLASNLEPEFMKSTSYREFDVVKEERLHGGIDSIPERLTEAVQADVNKVGSTVVKIGKWGHFGEVVQKQKGVFRVNCRGGGPRLALGGTKADPSVDSDCCDRTNLGQWIIAHTAILDYFKDCPARLDGSQLERALSKLWSKVSSSVSAEQYFTDSCSWLEW